jgi:hypothetical protein
MKREENDLARLPIPSSAQEFSMQMAIFGSSIVVSLALSSLESASLTFLSPYSIATL